MNQPFIATVMVATMAFASAASTDHIRTGGRYFPLNMIPDRIVSTDLNADDRDDLIVFAASPLRYQVLLSKPDGTWDTHPEVQIEGNHIGAIKIADVNTDGREDILVLPSFSRYFHVLLNTGDGTLTAGAGTPTFSDTSSQTFGIGDLNNDSHPDLVIGQPRKLCVLYNSGAGDFTNPGTFVTVTPSTMNDIVVGDYRGTGQNEIATIAGNNAYFAHFESSEFVESAVVPLALSSFRATSADVTGDGASDLITIGSSSPVAVVTRFDPAVKQYVTSPPSGTLSSYSATDAAFGDVSGNGLPDIVPAGSSSAIAKVLYSSVNSNPPVQEIGPALGTFYEFKSVTIGDVDNDGLNDLVYGTTNVRGIVVFIQDDGGGFARSGIHEITGSAPINTVRLREEQGRPVYFEGVSSTSQSGRMFSIVPVPGGFRIAVTPLPSVPGALNAFWNAGDINGDGMVDLVRASFNSTLIFWQLGQADGTFGPALTRAIGSTTSGVRSVAIADFNDDGIDDVAAVTSDAEIHIGLGRSNGFLAPLLSTSTVSTPDTATLRAKDLDADGKTDLIFVANGDGVVICYGRGDGTFEPFTLIPTISIQSMNNDDRMDVGDLNGDGYDDVLVANSNGSVIHLSTGPRSYEPYTTVSNGTEVTRARFIDFDGDGLLDIATTARGRTEFVTRTGRGLLEARSSVLHTRSMPFCDFPDLDGDGRPEILYSSSLGVSIMFNRSDDPCIADHYTDGRLDLFDFAQFIRNFNDFVAIADVNRDGAFTFFDIARFIELFQLGCP